MRRPTPASCRLTTLAAAFLALQAASSMAQETGAPLEEIQVIGTTPGTGLGVAVNKVPFAVKTIQSTDLERSQSVDLVDYLNQNTPGVNINSAQNNPLQQDLLSRGFTASPLLGLPQGIAVYQNGARINEPLGDAVNWDLIPESAIAGVDMISGADPLFGLNTLGGALVLKMKDGFNFTGSQAEFSTGSWGRNIATLESGGNDGSLGYYVNISRFEEDGWRQLSSSEATNFYGAMSWRNENISALNLSYATGDSDLVGNGAAPTGLLALQRDAIFTAPDITENDMNMLDLDVSHYLTPNVQLVGNVFWRDNKTDSFNGDGSEYELCGYAGGAQSLFEEADDIEDALESQLGIELDELCEGGDPAITGFTELESFIESQALAAGLDPEDFELEDVVDDLSGTGILVDEAINNISQRRQTSEGLDGKVIIDSDLFGRENHFTAGFSYFRGESSFASVLELSRLDPVTRSTQGLGVGTFHDESATNVKTETETRSLFLVDTFSVNDNLTLIFGGRFNDTDVVLRDRSGVRPELNGDHNFSRFNPSLGMTYDVNDDLNVYASYSESNRVPTPIELACNEGVFSLAQEFAVAAGEDPDDIEFECRLPNAFLADPPLDDVVTKSVELGMRGMLSDINYQLGFFHADNQDDIIFQTTGRSTGLFANVDDTLRWGLESMVSGSMERLDWFASFSYTDATFEDNFLALSPNHPNADDEGSIQVSAGDRIPGIPESLLKLGGDFHVTDSLSLGAEAIYNSSQFLRGDESNDMDPVDGYAVVNLRANFSVGDRFSLYARVTNALDEDYENFGLLGEDPTEILENINPDPVFLGVGAPRAAWVGLRFKF